LSLSTGLEAPEDNGEDNPLAQEILAKWKLLARPDQLAPDGEWSTWLLLAGRGYGKTRTAAEDTAYYALTHPKSRIAVVAETFSDGRDTCMEGESGLLSVLPHDAIKSWNRSLGELILTNESRCDVYSGDKPDGLRGPSHHRLWCDELAKFRYARDTWDNAMLGLRLGDARAIVTTTPKPTTIIKELVADPATHVTRGSTYDNIDNLSPRFRERVLARYEGTRMGRQELHAEILDDVPGALWTRQMVDDARVREAPEIMRVMVAIDPAVTSGEDSDETGIVVAGKGVDGLAYVLADRSCRMSPDGWAMRAVAAYDEFGGDRIIAEINNGGDLVESVLRTAAPRIPYKKIHASRGKRIRAEPVAALYEQRKVRHLAAMPELEDQMVSFVPEGMDGSPDRVDALVWALTELMIPEHRGRRKMKVHR
jgi:phage terminase large subunit-like protein